MKSTYNHISNGGYSIIHDFREANKKFSEVLNLMFGINLIRFEAISRIGYYTEYSLILNFGNITLGVLYRPDIDNEYLIYGLGDCHGYMLLPEMLNDFLIIVEDELKMSVNEITYGVIDYET